MRITRVYADSFRGFTRDTRLFIVGAFLVSMGSNLIWLLFNLYQRALGFPESQIGDNLALRSLGAVIASLPATLIAGRGRLKGWLVGASAFNAMAFVVVSFASSLLLMRGSILSIGIFSTIYTVASAPFLMRSTRAQERPFAFSLNAALGNLSGVLGSLIGGFSRDILSQAIGSEIQAYRWALVSGAVFSLASIIPFAAIQDGKHVDKLPATGDEFRQAPRERVFIPGDLGLFVKLLSPAFLIGIGAGLTIPFINLYFKLDWKLSDSAIGLIFGTGQAFTFIGMAISPLLVHKTGRTGTIILTQACSIPFIMVLAWLKFFPLVVLAFVVRQMLMNMSTPVNDQFTMEMVRPESRALINALKQLTWTASWVLSASLGGRIIESGSFAMSFTVTACLYVLATTLFWIFFHKQAQKNP